ncbi:hypothetical protein MMC29_007935 [Sticta canariensis]|nr:hypothetical protein [Sticta canariensis]
MAPFVMLCLRRVAIRALPLTSTPIAARLRPITTLTSPITGLNKQAHFSPPLQRRFASGEATRDEYETATDGEPGLSIGSAIKSASNTVYNEVSDSIDSVSESARGVGASATDGPGLYNPEAVSTVFVGNLFFHLQQEDLVKAFETVGPVKSAKIAMDHNNQSRGFGYIDFEDPATAQKAVQVMHLKLLEGRPMSVQLQNARSSLRATRPPVVGPTRTLFIGNMPFDMSDRDLNNLFSTLKNIVDVRVAIDRRTGQPRGFAHADFADEESAENGRKILQDTQLGGRTLRVDFSLSTSAPRTPSGTSPR